MTKTDAQFEHITGWQPVKLRNQVLRRGAVRHGCVKPANNMDHVAILHAREHGTYSLQYCVTEAGLCCGIVGFVHRALVLSHHDCPIGQRRVPGNLKEPEKQKQRFPM